MEKTKKSSVVTLDQDMNDDIRRMTDEVMNDIMEPVSKTFSEQVGKFNPYHDKSGRFATGSGFIGGWGGPDDKRAVTFSANPNTRAGAMAIQREGGNHESIGRAYGNVKVPPKGAAGGGSATSSGQPKNPAKEGKNHQDTVRNIEDKRRKQNYESAAIVDGKGKVILDKDGAKSSVSFSNLEVRMMRGNTLTHNHPSGSNFSVEDVNMLVKSGLNEIRATRPQGGVYSLKQVSTNANAHQFVQEYHSNYKKNQNATQNKLDSMDYGEKIMKGKMTAEQANRDFRSNISMLNGTWLYKNAPKYGYKFALED